MWIFALIFSFVTIPLLEIALFIQIGKAIGTLATVAMVLALGAAGMMLAKWQGLKVFREIMESFYRGKIPADGLIEGALVLAAGVLLITPGFLTDAIGLAILLPPGRKLMRTAMRRMAIARLSKRISRCTYAFKI